LSIHDHIIYKVRRTKKIEVTSESRLKMCFLEKEILSINNANIQTKHKKMDKIDIIIFCIIREITYNDIVLSRTFFKTT